MDNSSNVPSNNNISDKELALRRLEFDEKKAEQEHQIRLREIGLKEAENKRSRWSSPLVLSIIAAAIAAGGNGYISWLNGANQLGKTMGSHLNYQVLTRSCR